jgi:2-phospho-L-lactate guanylyltransferase
MKELALAKARLSPVLDAAGRRALALAMFRDVLEAALGCEAIEGVAVVSRDAEVLDEARSAGAVAMPEPGGLNEALDEASRKLAARGVERILVLAADVPLATPKALAAALGDDADVTLIPSLDGGTNILVSEPGAIAFKFGEASAARHLEAARDAGLRTASLDMPELSLDIDTPADLERLSSALPSKHAAGRTSEVLRKLGLLRAAAER